MSERIEIHPEWEALKQFIQACIDMRGSISDEQYQARLKECERVDQPGVKRTEAAEWVTQTLRDGYLAAIMRGSINIGS